MNHSICQLVIFALLSTAPVAAAELSDKRFAAPKKEYLEQLANVRKGVEAALKKAVSAAQRRGDLESVKAAQLALQNAKEKGELPSPLPTREARVLVRARTRITSDYSTIIKSLVREGKIGEAEKAKEELEVLLTEPRTLTLAFNSDIPITSRNPIGYDLGKVRRGERFALQYISGKWKGWGRYPTQSPDTDNPEKGDRCRVAIGAISQSGTFERLAVVPALTVKQPFYWIATRDYDKVVLRINDSDGKFSNNPDKGVKYRFAAYRYPATSITK